MDDTKNLSVPDNLLNIEQETKALGFTMPSDYKIGSLLRTLVASKRGGRILELGTGTGLSSCWLLDGMDKNSKLITVDNDPKFMDIAKKFLADDNRIEFCMQDGSDFLKSQSGNKFDFIFADTWPGKYWDLDLALELLDQGGLYVIDDMLPQENWTEDHPPKVANLIKDLENKTGHFITKLVWSTGIILVTKI